MVEGIVRELGMDIYTLLYLEWITSKDLWYSTWNTPHYSAPAWMGGAYGEEWIQVCAWLSPITVHLNYHNTVNQL